MSQRIRTYTWWPYSSTSTLVGRIERFAWEDLPEAHKQGAVESALCQNGQRLMVHLRTLGNLPYNIVVTKTLAEALRDNDIKIGDHVEFSGATNSFYKDKLVLTARKLGTCSPGCKLCGSECHCCRANSDRHAQVKEQANRG